MAEDETNGGDRENTHISVKAERGNPDGYRSFETASIQNGSESGWFDNISLIGRNRGVKSIMKSLFCCENNSDTLENGYHGNESTNPRRTLSTFSGVLAPVALSMFSTLLFLRAGFLVGQAGILESAAILILAYFILVMTVLSICAISTNGALERGGAYYMISRALGPEFGGGIGFLFFVANVLATGLYVSGFVEAVLVNFGPGGTTEGVLTNGSQWYKYLYSTVVLFLCLLVCVVGGAVFAKTSAFIFTIVIICTLSVFISIFVKHESFQVPIPISNHIVQHDNNTNLTTTGTYTGLSSKTFSDNLFPSYQKDYSSHEKMNFASVFAIVFSSVTGILNGANMSGELKAPGKAIPIGTMCAIAFTFCFYFIETLLIGASCERFLLVNNYNFLQSINLWGPFVLIGIFSATLSAALGNLIGASRILEALANDELFWFFLKPATVTTKGGNPYVAVLISWILVQLVLLVGSLNAIAPAASVFFLLSYASVNLACLALELASAPNFRPTFKYFSWYTCGLGLIGCMVMCFLISPIYTSVAVIIILVLAIVLHFRSVPAEWGSISQALIFHQVRKYLLMLDPRKAHVKYWRPQMLLMVAQPRQCCELIDFINDIKKGGLYVIGHVKVGKIDDYPKDPIIEESKKWMSLIDHLKVKAFVEVTLSESVSDGMLQLVRLSGLGGMKPNSVCLGFYDSSKPMDSLPKTKPKRKRFFNGNENGSYVSVEGSFSDIRRDFDPKLLSRTEYVKMIKDVIKLQKNVCVFRHFNQLNKTSIFESKGNLYIDVWPVNMFRPETASFFDNACLFMLQLACILNMVPGWKSKTQLRVFLCLNAQTDNTLEKEQKLDAYLRELRIIAKIQIITWDHLFQHLPELQSRDYESAQMQQYHTVSDNFIREMNQLITSYSSRTTVSFLYLPQPPSAVEQQEDYLQKLEMLSENLPPTVFIHGLHPVTSTTL